MCCAYKHERTTAGKETKKKHSKMLAVSSRRAIMVSFFYFCLYIFSECSTINM